MTIYTPKKKVEIHFSLITAPSQLIYANALDIQGNEIYVIYDNNIKYAYMRLIHGNNIFINIKKKDYIKQHILKPSDDGSDLVAEIEGEEKSISELSDFFESSQSKNEYVSGGARKMRKKRHSRKKNKRSKNRKSRSNKLRRSKKRRN